MSVRVACLADRDIPPDEAKRLLSAERKTESEWTPGEIGNRIRSRKANDGDPVSTEVSPCWTFEFDLALMTDLAPYLHVAISLAKSANPTHASFPVGKEAKKIIRKANAEYKQWHDEGKSAKEIACMIYEPLLKSQVSKAETAQCLASLLEWRNCTPNWDEARWRQALPSYLVRAIDHATVATNTNGAEDEEGNTLDATS
jgi:putative ATP-dependent endonuclease of OLD family